MTWLLYLFYWLQILVVILNYGPSNRSAHNRKKTTIDGECWRAAVRTGTSVCGLLNAPSDQMDVCNISKIGNKNNSARKPWTNNYTAVGITDKSAVMCAVILPATTNPGYDCNMPPIYGLQYWGPPAATCRAPQWAQTSSSQPGYYL